MGAGRLFLAGLGGATTGLELRAVSSLVAGELLRLSRLSLLKLWVGDFFDENS